MTTRVPPLSRRATTKIVVTALLWLPCAAVGMICGFAWEALAGGFALGQDVFRDLGQDVFRRTDT